MDPEHARWTDAQFDEMSWHDNHVHSLEIRSGEYGAGELLLGLGYILEWLPPEDGSYSFRIAPALLQFREVTDLSIELDYASVSAGLTPFSISSITREIHRFPSGAQTHRWTLGINWPQGSITFLASGFVQTLTGPAVISRHQFLSLAERLA
jgi:hypothetical protein